MEVLLILVLYLLALAFCSWLFWQSVKLIIRGFKQAFGLSLVPRPAPSIAGRADLPNPVPAWTARMVEVHIARCQECRESYVTGTLPLLAPETLTRIVGICEAEDALVQHKGGD